MLYVIVLWEMQVKSTVTYHFAASRVAVIKVIDKNRSW